MMKINIQNS